MANKLYIAFHVNGMQLFKKRMKYLAAGSNNFIALDFSFSDEWQGLDKFAVCYRNNQEYTYALDDFGCCTIADPVVIATDGVFKVKVLGANDEVTVASSIVEIQINDNTFAGAESGTIEYPTDDFLASTLVWVKADATAAAASATSAKNYAEAAEYASTHALKGDKGDKGDTGPAGADGAPGPAGADGKDGKDGKDSDVTKAYVDGKVSELNGDIANCSANITKVGNNVETLKKMAKGILYEYQTDSTSAYSKVIPAGAKVMDIKIVQSGKSFVEDEELITVNTASLQIKGKNLFQTEYLRYPYNTSNNELKHTGVAYYRDFYSDVSGGSNGVLPEDVYKLPILEAGTYTVSFSCDSNYAVSQIYLAEVNDDGSKGSKIVTCSSTSATTFSITEPIRYTLKKPGNKTVVFKNIQIERGSVATTYSEPNKLQTITIPTEIVIGKSAGTVYDANEFYSVEQTEGSYKYFCKHTQRVDSVDLGTLTYTLDEYNRFMATKQVDIADKVVRKLPILCAKYTCLTNGEAFDETWDDVIYGERNNKNVANIYIHDSTYTDVNELKSALSGVYLYFEMLTPIETITELSQNLFEALTVEGGGSITFVGNNENYNLPMANEEEYLVYLNEVSE